MKAFSSNVECVFEYDVLSIQSHTQNEFTEWLEMIHESENSLLSENSAARTMNEAIS